MESGKIEQDPEKAEEILKIVGIYFANTFGSYVCFKVSRFNHSCQPNATVIEMSDQKQLRAIGKIKAGKEINLNYLGEFDKFSTDKVKQLLMILAQEEDLENQADMTANIGHSNGKDNNEDTTTTDFSELKTTTILKEIRIAQLSS